MDNGIYFKIGNEESHKTHPPIATAMKIIGPRYICCLLATSVDLFSLLNFINVNLFRTKFLIPIPHEPIPPRYLIGKFLFQLIFLLSLLTPSNVVFTYILFFKLFHSPTRDFMTLSITSFPFMTQMISYIQRVHPSSLNPARVIL